MALLDFVLGEVELIGLGHGLEDCGQIFGHSGQGFLQATPLYDGIELVILRPCPIELYYGRGEHL